MSSWSELDRTTQIACAELWEHVWPTSGSPDTEARLHKMQTRSPGLRDERIHLAFDPDGTVVALARTFEHTIGYGDGDREIVALASVCSDPQRRGEGFGDAVVHAAFRRVDDRGVPSLFQTPVPGFYERFDCRVVNNEITTTAPGAEAFDDPWAMIYPADQSWTDDLAIDLRSPGW